MRFGETKQHLDFLQKIQAPGQPRPPREGISHPSQRPNAPNSTQHRRRQRPNESAHAGHARRGEEKTEAPNQPTVSVLAGKGGRQLLTQVCCAWASCFTAVGIYSARDGVVLLALACRIFRWLTTLCGTTDASPTAPASEVGSSACSTSCVCISTHGSWWLGFASPVRPARQKPRWVCTSELWVHLRDEDFGFSLCCSGVTCLVLVACHPCPCCFMVQIFGHR